ncbi:unnamed protein product [Paramecium sonneborni]|uniref:Uncharacterized protein n=1 Tax=Paramecium sonneborni TaxID=65129 RepID=A0A8S1PQ29_9CILI|nr:unnamed protein product [Paramecium sonneborni]
MLSKSVRLKSSNTECYEKRTIIIIFLKNTEVLAILIIKYIKYISYFQRPQVLKNLELIKHLKWIEEYGSKSYMERIAYIRRCNKLRLKLSLYLDCKNKLKIKQYYKLIYKQKYLQLKEIQYIFQQEILE